MSVLSDAAAQLPCRDFLVFRCAPDESTYNPLGIVHGGLLCTLLDSAAGCAVHTQLPAGTGYGSIALSPRRSR
jgi:acyl-coenzyme A thioesterase PaaI-like protein